MNSIRDSQSSYGDPRYLSTMTASDAPAPLHGRSLVDGYRDALDPQHDDRSRYNPVGRDIIDLGDQTQTQRPAPANRVGFVYSSTHPTRAARFS
jgi:hypothetical protein